MSTHGHVGTGIPAGGKGQTAEAALLPGQPLLDRRRRSAGLSHLVERYHLSSLLRFCAAMP